MAGIGGQPKLSVQQQDAAISDLVPSLLAGERLIELSKNKDGTENNEIAELNVALARCLSEIRELISEVEAGHSRMSSIDPEDLELVVDFLVKEVKQIGSRLKTALALAIAKSR